MPAMLNNHTYFVESMPENSVLFVSSVDTDCLRVSAELSFI